MKVTHGYAGCAIQGCAVEDGGGADDQAEHDQAIDHKVLQGVPPVDGWKDALTGLILLSCIFISYVYHGRNIFSASVWPMREPKRAVPRVAIASKNPQTQGWRITSFLGLVLLV